VPPTSRGLTVRTIDAATHERFVTQHSGSFLQEPSWAGAKSYWRPESVGWFDGEQLVGAGLVLYRAAPVIRRSLAYLPEGPVVDWATYDVAAITPPLLTHLKRRGAFTVKIGPQLVTRTWTAATIKQAIADGVTRIASAPPDRVDEHALQVAAQLRAQGWTRKETDAGSDGAGAGFGDFQPRYVFVVPLRGRTRDEVFAGFNQLWRRNVRKAEKAGVVVTKGDYADLETFHRLYLVTAERDGFTPRPLPYFQAMWRAMHAEDDQRLSLYLAAHDGQALAAATCVRVGRRVWYSYGASADVGRDVRPSNALQWQMMCDALDTGADVYDLRGISDTLVEDDPLFGLIRFKVGTGGEAHEYLGEWDRALNRPLAKAFDLYLSRR
jgi:lipid II:glycine glycyltransferase (peptidoglycan interpeptide bridge formation enzyme)